VICGSTAVTHRNVIVTYRMLFNVLGKIDTLCVSSSKVKIEEKVASVCGLAKTQR
jgi:hypothetical protein